MTATLIGATGLIGGYLLEELLKDKNYDTVSILIRRPIEQDHPRLKKKLIDFNDHDSFLSAMKNSDVVFCSVGTTRKKVKGNKAAYRKVDYDIPVNAALFSKMAGCEKFMLVSSVGAKSKSNNFYLKLKGEVEEDVKAVARPDDPVGRGLSSVHIMRPSMLLGDRKEFRMGEKIGKRIMKAFSFLIPSKYKPIQARDVALAMIAAARIKEDGFFVYEFAGIKGLIK